MIEFVEYNREITECRRTRVLDPGLDTPTEIAAAVAELIADLAAEQWEFITEVLGLYNFQNKATGLTGQLRVVDQATGQPRLREGLA